MPARRIGVKTIPGHLTYFLEELELTRKDIAELLGVSVRTIHNIEHGRKAVDPQLLSRLASCLNEHNRRIGPGEPLQLTADHFVRSPKASTSVFLQTILTNRSENLFLGDNPVAGPEFHWFAPGSQQLIPFAGEYKGEAARVLIDRLHQAVGAIELNQVRMLEDPVYSSIVVAAVARFRHPLSGHRIDFKAYLEVEAKGDRLGRVESTYDTELLSYFMQTGTAPSAKKSDLHI